MAGKQTTQAQPEAAHAQAADPGTQALQQAGPAAPPFSSQEPAGASGQTSEQHRLQDLLPQIREVAQKVGGFKRLAEIAETLAQSKE